MSTGNQSNYKTMFSSMSRSPAAKGHPKQTVQRKGGFEVANPGLLTEEGTMLALIQYT